MEKNEEYSKEIDQVDLKIIQLLASGVRNKNLTQHLFLSNSAIEKRKKRLKTKHNIVGNDEDLLNEARKRGWI